MQHIILTRFNLKTNFWGADKNRNKVLDNSWLSARIELFLQFCLPSVVGQTNKNFFWLIFFQKGTEDELSEVLQKIGKYDFIKPIFCEDYEDFGKRKGELVSDFLHNDIDYLITTRLDNDDAISKVFIENIQIKYNENMGDEYILDFPMGLCLDINGSPKLSSYRHVSNQFISYVERIEESQEPKTVLSQEHYGWKKLKKYISVENKNMWLQVSHDRNVTNRLEGSLVFKENIKDFSIAPINFQWYYNASVIFQRSRQPFPKMRGKYFLKRMISKFKK